MVNLVRFQRRYGSLSLPALVRGCEAMTCASYLKKVSKGKTASITGFSLKRLDFSTD